MRDEGVRRGFEWRGRAIWGGPVFEKGFLGRGGRYVPEFERNSCASAVVLCIIYNSLYLL